VFSSPPYFDREQYSAEPNQSFLRYPDFRDWVNSFLAPVLSHSARVLKPGGVMLLNVTDRPDLNLMQLAITLCERQLVFMGWIPYPMRANPVGGMDSVLKIEPILVFQKPSVDSKSLHQKIRIFGGMASIPSYGRAISLQDPRSTLAGY